MYTGNRVYYNQNGNIVFMSGEIEGGTEQRPAETIKYIDIPTGTIDYSKVELKGVDVKKRKLIYEDLVPAETEEQRRIKELEEYIKQLEGK